MPDNAGRKKSRNHTVRLVSMVLFFSLSLFSCADTATKPTTETGAPASTSATSGTKETTAQNSETTTTSVSEPTQAGTTETNENNLPVSDKYFDDAVFIGNSIVDTFQMYSGLDNATFYAATSLTVRSAYTKPAIKINGSKIPVMDAIKQHSFKKVYIMFGLNELGWPATDVFVEEYGKLIDDIKKAQPEAVIYIQSIMPVSAKKSQNDPYENNKNILKFNQLIQNIAKDKQVFYLNIYDSMINGEGCLLEEASTDGVHFNKKYCLKWLDYLKSHTASTNQ